MAEYIIPLDSLYNESEFNAGSGACGPTILAGAGRWTTRSKSPTAQDAMQHMIAWGLCSSTGVTTLRKLYIAAGNYKYPRALNQNPQTGVFTFIMDTMRQTNGRRQGLAVCGLSNGQAIVDYLSRQGQDAVNLKGHFIGLFGYNSGGYSQFLGCNVPEGFLAIDGDNGIQNPVVPGVGRIHRHLNAQFMYYTLATLRQAQLYDAFSITR